MHKSQAERPDRRQKEETQEEGQGQARSLTFTFGSHDNQRDFQDFSRETSRWTTEESFGGVDGESSGFYANPTINFNVKLTVRLDCHGTDYRNKENLMF